ncbi:protein of unknown function [Pustulibacterium marinum]|uniref:DUF4382 domain-containing protein n=1 Tax=Pustulibacterium marinum TaxID=1224947 RepID=A0A1I7I2G0_9FLAO|nr:DUF4382 domain-containing protein [Pustulibacterium marinum]SFU67095.1 protein of unknown function [Pustulibacterium marinum]
MKKKNVTLLAILFSGLFVFTSCSDDDNDSEASTGDSAKMSVKMVDAPGDYDAVNIEVEDVVIKYANDTEVSLDVDDETYDLLQLTGGANAQLALEEDIPAGTISQIRLVLGGDNSIVVDGETYDLATPSAQQSGLKLNVNETLEAGYTYEYILDFDVEESIVTQGNGSYSLKPTIRATATAETGIIEGVVVPAGIPTLVTATNGSVEVSTYANADGSYALYGLPEGSYTLTFTPALGLGLEALVLYDVVAVNGQIMTVDTVTFETE